MPKKKAITASELEDLRHFIQGMLQNILLNADAFIFKHETSAYESVSVQVRKLLLDGNAPRSYDKATRHPNLLALAYGGADHIFVNDNPAPRRSQDEQGYDWFPKTPSLYASPESMISVAWNGTRQLNLRDWLNHYVTGCHAVGCRCAEGSKRSEKVSELLRFFADKEGAHRLNHQRERGGIAISSADAQDGLRPRDFDVAWQQFAVEAGLKVAFAKQVVDGKQRPIMDLKWFSRHYPHWKTYMTSDWLKQLPRRNVDINDHWHMRRMLDQPNDPGSG